MAFQLMSIGDIVMLSQTAWKLGRAFSHGKKIALSEFAEVERQANRLSEAFKLFAETLHTDGCALSDADDDTVSAVDSILDSAKKTLDALEKLVDKYQVTKKKETSGGGFAVERSWSDAVATNYRTFKWTAGGGNINDLRNMLQMHTNSINLTMQALQSRSLARLEKTVIPMADHIVSIRGCVNGAIGDKIDHLHLIIMSVANSTTSLGASDRAIEPSSERHSISTASTVGRSPLLLGHRPTRSSSFNKSSRQASCGPRLASPPRAVVGLTIRENPDRELAEDYNLEPPPDNRTGRDGWGFISVSRPGGESLPTSPRDSAYGTSSSSRSDSHARKDSQTLPRTAHEESDDKEQAASAPPPIPMRSSWRSSTGGGMLPPPALSAADTIHHPGPPATPYSFFASFKKAESNVGDVLQRPRPPKSAPNSPRPSTGKGHSRNVSAEAPTFEKQLFRNAAILCDVRCRLVEYAQPVPDEPDPRYNVEMIPGCQEARVCVIRKRENRALGGSKVVTSIWCLSDDGEVRLQQKLSEEQETVPYCSYFDPEKVSILPTDNETPIILKLHDAEWGSVHLEEKKTSWVNYCLVSEQDAVAFQSAVFGRLLLGSYRTTKTTVIHDGLKGHFAFEEQFANIEMLRLWEDDGVSTPGAAGGVMALMHISSSFGEGCELIIPLPPFLPIANVPQGLGGGSMTANTGSMSRVTEPDMQRSEVLTLLLFVRGPHNALALQMLF